MDRNIFLLPGFARLLICIWLISLPGHVSGTGASCNDTTMKSILMDVVYYEENDYDAGTGPPPHDLPTEVTFEVLIRSIPLVDEQSKTVYTSLVLYSTFEDKRLDFTHILPNYESECHNLEYLDIRHTSIILMWLPVPIFTSIDAGTYDVRGEFVRLYRNGTVNHFIYVSLALPCEGDSDLKCSLIMEPFGDLKGDLLYKWGVTNPVKVAKGVFNPSSYDVGEAHVEQREISDEYFGNYNGLVAHIPLKKK